MPETARATHRRIDWSNRQAWPTDHLQALSRAIDDELNRRRSEVVEVADSGTDFEALLRDEIADFERRRTV